MQYFMRRAPMGSAVEAIANTISDDHVSEKGKPLLAEVQTMCTKWRHCVATPELGGNINAKLVRRPCTTGVPSSNVHML